MNNKLYDHISKTILGSDGSNLKKITPDMFELTDIVKVEQHSKFPELICVVLRGINGSIPWHFFSVESQGKIKNYVKIRNSDLWRTLND